jgi:hypothetical protein
MTFYVSCQQPNLAPKQPFSRACYDKKVPCLPYMFDNPDYYYAKSAQRRFFFRQHYFCSRAGSRAAAGSYGHF